MYEDKLKIIRNKLVKIKSAGFCSDCICGNGRTEKCLEYDINAKVTAGNFINSFCSAIFAIPFIALRLFRKQLIKTSSVKIA